MTTTTTTKPSTRRLDAMHDLTAVTWGRPTEQGSPFLLTLDDKVDTVNAIYQLRHLGRTDRWQGAITEWAEQVAAAKDLDTLRWAFTQYGIWAAYAAE